MDTRTVNLIGNDGVAVAFGINEIHRVPYATDILDLTSTDLESLPVVGHDHTDLLKVKQMLKMQSACGVAFKVPPVRKTVFGVEIVESAFVCESDPWDGKAPYMSVLNSYTAAELLGLLKCANFLHCTDLVYAPAYALLRRYLDYDAETRDMIGRLDGFYLDLIKNIRVEDYPLHATVPAAVAGSAGATATATA